jgi:hypothetical protein
VDKISEPHLLIVQNIAATIDRTARNLSATKMNQPPMCGSFEEFPCKRLVKSATVS